MGTRKNAVNRELHPIAGGVCAPEGFRAGGAACGFKKGGVLDVGLIVPLKRCPTACVFSTSSKRGDTAIVSERHMENGHAHAILVNGGVANLFQPNGERMVKDATRLVDRYCNVVTEDVIVASTGVTGQNFDMVRLENGIRDAAENLSATHEASFSVAQAMASEGVAPLQLSYEFELGAFVCKIGAVFKGNVHVSPNMATTLAFLTTDVNISPQMLRKALLHGVNETLNLLDIDGVASPNDMVCIMANGKADNWRIDCVDTDYKKFVYALKETLRQICLRILCNAEEKQKILLCRVYGAKSTQVSRSLAKKLASSIGVKDAAKGAKVNAEDILFQIAEMGGVEHFDRVSISVRSEFGKAMIYEDGRRMPEMRKHLDAIFSSSCVEISVGLAQGNYTSTGYTCI